MSSSLSWPRGAPVGRLWLQQLQLLLLVVALLLL
jgi:hypothetical protein